MKRFSFITLTTLAISILAIDANADNRSTRYGHIEVDWNENSRDGKFRVRPEQSEFTGCSAVTGYVFRVISRDNTICGQAFSTGLKHMDWPLTCPRTSLSWGVNSQAISYNSDKGKETATEWANFGCY